MKQIGILIERQRAYGRSICLGISRFAQEHEDWSLKMLEWSDADNPRRLQDYDGFIVRILNERIARTFASIGKPVVDVFHEREWPGISSVDQHARLVGQMAARHFIEHKFTNFAFCGFNGRSYSDKRRDAFTRCLKLNHFTCSVYNSPPSALSDFDNAVIRQERLSFGADNRRMAKWVKALPKPIAVFCSHDLRAYQLIEICRKCDLRIPEDVAILGVDNDELVCNFITPTLSSIDLDGDLVGYTAASALSERLDNPDSPPLHHKINPKGLICRQSTQTYPLDPSWLSDALVFIRSNVTHHLTAADVFAHVGRSHTLVSQVFKKKLGTTVQKEIQRTRLVEAKRLVTTTTLPLTEIARRAGFASLQYFCTTFTAAFGNSPTNFRANSSVPSRRL